MKFKNIISVFTSLVITISCCMIPQTTIAENKYEDIEIKSVLSKDELPEAIDYDIAETKNHYKRLLEEEKNLNTIVFENTDGTNSLYLFSYPVKYRDSNGNVYDKSLNLIRSDKNSFVTESSNIITNFNYDLNQGINTSFYDNELLLTPMFINSNEAIARLSEDSKIVSYSLNNNITLEYSLTYQGYKENIVVDKYNSIDKYSFNIKTNGLHLEADDLGNTTICNSKGFVMANIGDIIVTDSNNNIVNGNIDYEEVEANQEYTINIYVDKEFLESPDTVYPIFIDPTLEVDYTHYGTLGYNGEAGIVHSTLYSDGTSTYNQTIHVGKVSNSKVARTIMRFPGLIEQYNYGMSSNVYGFGVMDRSLITSAKVYLKDIGYQSDINAMEVECHKYNNNWESSSNLPWTNYANLFDETILDSNVISYTNGMAQTPISTYSFDITQLVRQWNNEWYFDNYWKNGIMFKANSTVEDGTTLYSSFGNYNSIYYAPYLIIDYETPTNYEYADATSITYTYHSVPLTFNAGERWIFQTEKTDNYDDCDTELYFFKVGMNSTDSTTWYNDDISQSNRYSKIDVVIPSTGQYVLMAKVYSGLNITGALPIGHCKVCKVDPNTNVKTYLATDAKLGGYMLALPENKTYVSDQSNPIYYNSFTANLSSGYDTVMYVLKGTNTQNRRVIGYNDDYSNVDNPGEYSWNKNSRVEQTYNNFDNNNQDLRPKCVLVSSYFDDTVGNAEIYAICEGKYLDSSCFPNFKEDDSIKSDSKTNAYNCIAYSGGMSVGWINPNLKREEYPSGRLTPWYNSDNETAFDNFYGNNPPRYNGATTYINTANASEAIINVYKLGNNWTHASVKKPGNAQPHGYAWESKCGKEARVFHALNSLNNSIDGYGIPTRYYKISGIYTNNIPDITEGISYEESVELGYTTNLKVYINENEIVYLIEKINAIEQEKIETCNQLYASWITAIEGNKELSLKNDYYYYTLIDEYNVLCDYINENPELIYVIIRDYLEGINNVYITALFDYIIVERNDFTKQLANHIRETNNSISFSSMKDEKYIAPSIITNMQRFAVELLNEKAYNNIID